MKIVDRRTQENVFDLIKTGQCFMIDNQLFIKVGFFNEEEGGEVFNCVCLNDGSFYYANYDDEVEIVNAEIIVEQMWTVLPRRTSPGHILCNLPY